MGQETWRERGQTQLVLWAVAGGPEFHPTTPRTEAPHERGSSGFLVVMGRITKSGALGSQALWPPSDGSQIWTEEGGTSQQAAAKAGTSAWRAEVLRPGRTAERRLAHFPVFSSRPGSLGPPSAPPGVCTVSCLPPLARASGPWPPSEDPFGGCLASREQAGGPVPESSSSPRSRPAVFPGSPEYPESGSLSSSESSVCILL